MRHFNTSKEVRERIEEVKDRLDEIESERRDLVDEELCLETELDALEVMSNKTDEEIVAYQEAKRMEEIEERRQRQALKKVYNSIYPKRISDYWQRVGASSNANQG